MSKLTILLANSSMENFYHALVLATDARAMRWEVFVFVTSEAVILFTKKRNGKTKSSLGYLAGFFVKFRLRKLGVSKTEEMLRKAVEMGVKFFVDEIGLKLAGYTPDDIIDKVELSGGVSFLQEARESDVVVSL
ncbi:peroxiredoxin [Sulfolobales archaeon HS-7]|nr:peroxiredoxin [Sulfolobales archaeon HS-7]